MIPALLLPIWLLMAADAPSGPHADKMDSFSRVSSSRDSSGLPDPRILHIHQLYQQAESDSSFQRVTLSGSEFLDEEAATTRGASLTGYFKGDTLVKVSTKVGMSYAVFQENFYFEKGQLIYADELEKDFPPNADHSGLDHSKLIRAFQGTYYFDGYKAISIRTEGKRKVSEDEIHHPLELYHNAGYYYGLLMKRRHGQRA